MSCDDKSASFALNIANADKSLKLGESLEATIKNKKEKTIDSIVYALDGERLKAESSTSLSQKITEGKLGEKKLSATIYAQGDSETLSTTIKLFNNASPKSFGYEIVNTYPHDTKAFTQGLEFYNGTLYESTGRNGESGIRKVNYKTGEVLMTADLDISYFGEGITILNDKLYQLTWQGRKGFVYDVNTFDELSSFSYNSSKEGWGLCNDGSKLYKSDGTSRIWTLNAETLAEEDYIQTVSNKTITKKLNELEWAKGKIYANNWQIDVVSIINPVNGAIEGLVDFRGLRKEISTGQERDQQGKYRDVLNGIAYNPENDTFFVTGKNWDKLFEVKIVAK